jgi:hypothetical protein
MAFGALVLTGSRNGILLIAVSPVLVFVFWLIASPHCQKVSKQMLVKGSFGALIFLSAIVAAFVFFFDFFGVNAMRAFDFDLIGDASFQARVTKFFIGVADWMSNSLLFGASPFGAQLVWYDSGLGILLAHFGIIGCSIVFGGLALFYLNLFVPGGATLETRACFVILTLYIIVNFITEFALVSRSALPSVIYIIAPYAILIKQRSFNRLRS